LSGAGFGSDSISIKGGQVSGAFRRDHGFQGFFDLLRGLRAYHRTNELRLELPEELAWAIRSG